MNLQKWRKRVTLGVAVVAIATLYGLVLSGDIPPNTAAWMSTAIAASCALIYIHGAWFDTAKPEPVTWLVWAVAAGLGAGSAIEGGAGVAGYVAAVYIGLTGIIAVISVWKWVQHKRREQEPGYYWVIFVIGLAGTVLFFALDLPPAVGAFGAVVIDLIVFWPTVWEAWKDPSKEPAIVWGGDALATIVAVSVIFMTADSLAAWLFTLYLAVAQGFFTLMLIYRKRELGLPVR